VITLKSDLAWIILQKYSFMGIMSARSILECESLFCFKFSIPLTPLFVLLTERQLILTHYQMTYPHLGLTESISKSTKIDTYIHGLSYDRSYHKGSHIQ
jgi:hypothetical protein